MPAAPFPQVAVEIAFAAGPLDDPTSIAWTDVTRFVKQVDTKSGTTHETDQVDAGTATIVVKNQDNRFSTWNTNSPYLAGGGRLTPMRPVRVRATWGGTTYPVWQGLVQAFPNSWSDERKADVNLSCVDAFNLFSVAQLPDSVYDALLSPDNPTSELILDDPVRGRLDFGTLGVDGPMAWYRLKDAVGSTSLLDSAGGGHASAFQIVLSSSGLVVGGVGSAQFAGNGWIQLTATDAYLAEAVELFAQTSAPPATGAAIIAYQYNPATAAGFAVLLTPAGHVQLIQLHALPTVPGRVVESGPIGDGRPHQIAVSAANVLYVDGVQITAAPVTALPTWANQPAGMFIGGLPGPGGGPIFGFDGVVAEISTWKAPLNAAQVTEHYQAATVARSGELSGQRVEWVLDSIGWPAASRRIELGASPLQAALPQGQQALVYLQAVSVSEDGRLYMGADGFVVFLGRRHRYTNTTSTTSQVVLSETDAPYELGQTDVGMDVLDVYNDVTYQTQGGAPQRAQDATSQHWYGQRTYTGRTNLLKLSDGDCADGAAWFLVGHKDPLTRVRTADVHPMDDAAVLFPQVLARTLLDRVTFARRQPPGWDGTGASAFVQDCWIEGVEHHITKLDWRTTWRLAPVEPLPAGAAGYLFLDSPTDNLDESFVLAY